jgi:colanic acid/amylovoran biosynthesis protein
MMIEIRGVGSKNKGAELMLHAILQQSNTALHGYDFATYPWVNSYLKRARLGLYQKLWLGLSSDRSNYLFGLAIPEIMRKRYGLVNERDIDVLLDASGFAHSDQWGESPTEQLLSLAKRYKHAGKKIILLPQAFGPFSNKKIRKAFAGIIDLSDLIYARDEFSFDYIHDINPSAKNVKISPDFTCLVRGIALPVHARYKDQVCLIPNYRMIEKTEKQTGQWYITFLETSIRHLVLKREPFFILIHEGEKDKELGMMLKERTNIDIPLVAEDDPLAIKGILGNCKLVIGSRFHGLVSSMSQGIPSIGTSWSHKYKALFADYDCESYLVSSENSTSTDILDELLDTKTRKMVTGKIMLRSEEIKKKVEMMWSEIHHLLSIKSETVN